jgi:hypothetical protein
MGEQFTRRSVLGGMALEAANLLFSRKVGATEIFDAAQGVPAVGNTHLLTVVAVSAKTLRLRVIQQGKQGPAEEVGIVRCGWLIRTIAGLRRSKMPIYGGTACWLLR